jgi:hypothetical protein
MLRPKPVAQPTMKALRDLVPAGVFAGRRALVVGGSRGAGETVAKLYALGGAEVWFTYATGAADAERVAREIRAAGASARFSALDVRRPSEEALAAHRGWNPTDLAYFATPRIPITQGKTFSGSTFGELCAYYVAGFAQTFHGVVQPELVRALYPSSSFVDERPARFAEYVAAKAAGESMCVSLMQHYPRVQIATPRLPPMATDQTSEDASDPGRMLANHLLAMSGA